MIDCAHHCPDWDFLFIRPGDPEMECCLCGYSEATRRAALYDHERALEKTATYQSDLRCPGCNLNWWLFPPVHIHGLPKWVRCVECKRVYSEETGSEVNAEQS